MGQTLTHGIYLPDEGERNCYNGLAGNWTILDGAVGTIAEHSTQIAGKAPLVHTHTKADITDLFNSANTWSALNTYSNGQIRIKSLSQEIGVTPSSGVIQYLEFADKNDVQHGKVGLWDYDNGASEIQLSISDKYKDGVKDSTGTIELTFLSFGFKTDGSKFLTFSGQLQNSLVPNANNSYDLGSSSYQWTNLYAKRVNTQSVNGINPGALSLPNFNNADPIDFSQWDTTGAVGPNYYTPTVNGWLNISIWDRATNSIFVYRSGKERVGVFGNGSMASDGRIALLMPVQANATYIIIIKANANSDIYSANFFPCLGNV